MEIDGTYTAFFYFNWALKVLCGGWMTQSCEHSTLSYNTSFCPHVECLELSPFLVLCSNSILLKLSKTELHLSFLTAFLHRDQYKMKTSLHTFFQQCVHRAIWIVLHAHAHVLMANSVGVRKRVNHAVTLCCFC